MGRVASNRKNTSVNSISDGKNHRTIHPHLLGLSSSLALAARLAATAGATLARLGWEKLGVDAVG